MELTLGDQARSIVGRYVQKPRQIQWYDPLQQKMHDSLANDADNAASAGAKIPRDDPITRFWRNAVTDVLEASHTVVFDVPEAFIDKPVVATVYCISNEGKEIILGHANIVLPKSDDESSVDNHKKLEPQKYALSKTFSSRNNMTESANDKKVYLSAVVMTRKPNQSKPPTYPHIDVNSIYNNFEFASHVPYTNYFWWGHVLTRNHREPSLLDKYAFVEEEAALAEQLFCLAERSVVVEAVNLRLVHVNDEITASQLLDPLRHGKSSEDFYENTETKINSTKSYANGTDATKSRKANIAADKGSASLPTKAMKYTEDDLKECITVIFENGMTYNHNTKIKSTSHEMHSVEFNSCDVVYISKRLKIRPTRRGKN